MNLVSLEVQYFTQNPAFRFMSCARTGLLVSPNHNIATLCLIDYLTEGARGAGLY